MKGLDTNVLVRYLTQDDREQARAADRIVDDALASGQTLFLNAVVLCELAWVLRSAYRFDRATIASTLERILATRQFTIEAHETVRLALHDYTRGRGDFADHVIARRNALAGCDETLTFDRKLAGSALLRLV